MVLEALVAVALVVNAIVLWLQVTNHLERAVTSASDRWNARPCTKCGHENGWHYNIEGGLACAKCSQRGTPCYGPD